jgi:hypothetical protein
MLLPHDYDRAERGSIRTQNPVPAKGMGLSPAFCSKATRKTATSVIQKPKKAPFPRLRQTTAHANAKRPEGLMIDLSRPEPRQVRPPTDETGCAAPDDK